jgi:hypothetical protein
MRSRTGRFRLERITRPDNPKPVAGAGLRPSSPVLSRARSSMDRAPDFLPGNVQVRILAGALAAYIGYPWIYVSQPPWL